MRYVIVGILIALSSIGQAQILERLGKKVEQKVKQRIDRKTDRTIDKGLDKVEGAIDGRAKSKDNKASGNTKGEAVGTENVFRVNSDFDFIAGNRVLFSDDFSVDAVGDFPVKWNTNGSGEVVTLNGLDGKWLKVPDNTLSFAELGKALPENFTIEFDLFYPQDVKRPPITFGFTETADPAKEAIRYKKLFYFRLSATEDHVGYTTSLYSGRETNREWAVNRMAGKPIHVSIAVNKARIRLYMNQDKLFDLPKAFDEPALRRTFYFCAAEIIPAPEDGFYISNLRIAEAGTDLRSQLLKTGRYSTTGIYFNTNSAQIKAESAGILQEMATVLQENPEIRIQIVGHTDSDGEERFNLNLSKQRAEAVLNTLTTQYGIARDRMQADGKGESAPVDTNGTPAGKANNRRVEFVVR